jgi:hypothetical protein
VAMREPLQRSTTIYTGKRLDERIGNRAANVESILIVLQAIVALLLGDFSHNLNQD